MNRKYFIVLIMIFFALIIIGCNKEKNPEIVELVEVEGTIIDNTMYEDKVLIEMKDGNKAKVDISSLNVKAQDLKVGEQRTFMITKIQEESDPPIFFARKIK